MTLDQVFSLARRIAASAASAMSDAGWEPADETLIGNDPDWVIVLALEAYADLGRPVPEALMADIMAYLDASPNNERLWERAINTGLVTADMRCAA